MRTNDVAFTVNAGDEKGKTYGFTLAIIDGKKAWEAKREVIPPPSLIKYRIDMVITAAEGNISSSGAKQLTRLKTITAELEELMKQNTAITLLGFDKAIYSVLFDAANGLSTRALISEKERETEYQVVCLCWGLWE